MAATGTQAELVEAIGARVFAPGGLDAFEQQSEMAHHCSHPVRLHGHRAEVDHESGEILGSTDHLVLKACGNRRSTRCVACADVYRHDARHLAMAGLVGGKEMPASVVTHPMVFVTFTAPSFGSVHAMPKSGPGTCHAGSPSKRCAHSRPLACFDRHENGDPRVGQPICDECYRYDTHLMFNAHLTELWRRTTIYVFRSLAKVLGTTPKELAPSVRLSYLKVVEYQARGAAHLHVVVRADGIGESGEIVAPPGEVTTAALAEAVLAGSNKVSIAYPIKTDGMWRHARWGTELDVSVIDSAAAARRAGRYLSKYVSKSTESTGALDRRIHSQAEVDSLANTGLSPHHARLVRRAWHLGGKKELAHLGLRRSANALGFGGHVLSKSRRYSTTLTALRQYRHDYQCQKAALRAPPGHLPVFIGEWRYGGSGYGLAGDHLIAEMWARQSIEMRRVGWEELTTMAA